MFNFKKKKPNLKEESKLTARYLVKLLSFRIVRYAVLLLIIIILFPFLIFLYLRPEPAENINYGITFSNKYATQLGMDWKETYIKILDDLGTDNLRLVAYWEDIEAEKDKYDFSDIEWQLEEAQKRKIPVILTVGKKVPRYPECFPPKWWNEIEDEKIRDIELFEFLKTSVTTLKKYENIAMWQVENEPFFPFGDCKYEIKYSTLRKEVEVVREIDQRPIVIQDSGEGGFWYPTYSLGDYLAISMYRKIWYDFWGALNGNFIYFKYPLAHWSYKIKADFAQVPYQKIIVTELQGEPWGPRINSLLTEQEKSMTMSRSDFLATLSYAQQAGFKDIYIWGAEWWLWEKETNGNSFYWDTAKALFN